MKVKLLVLLSLTTLLTACAGYDSAFCRGDYCTDTSYMPNSYSDNTDYNCGQRGSGFASCSSSGGGSCGGGGSCSWNSSSCSGSSCGGQAVYGCKEAVWDNMGSVCGGY